MATLQSKKVNIVLDSNNDVDLYDEQIDKNKNLSEQNQKDIAKLKGLIANNDSEITLVKNQVTALKNAKPILTQAEADKLRQDVDNATKIANTNTTNLTNLTNKVNVNTTNLSNTTNDLTNLTTIVKQIDQATTGGTYTSGIGGGGSSSSGGGTGLNTKLANLNTRLTNDEADIKKLQTDVDTNKTSINNLTSQLSILQTNVNNNITDINNKNGVQDGRLTSLENTVTNLNTQLNGSGGSIQTQIDSIKSDINKINNITIPPIKSLSDNAYNKALDATNTINNTIKPQITNLNTKINDVESDVNTLSDTIEKTIIPAINTNKTNIANNTKAINDLKNYIKANVQDKTIVAGGNATINYDSSMDLYSMQIKLLVKDTTLGSRTINKYINAEGVCTLTYNSKSSITLYNDSDTQLDFKIIVSI